MPRAVGKDMYIELDDEIHPASGTGAGAGVAGAGAQPAVIHPGKQGREARQPATGGESGGKAGTAPGTAPGADPLTTLANDERLADYLHLTDVALRRKIEPERGLFMAESTNVITRAINAGYQPRSVLMARRWKDALAPVLAAAPACAGRGDGGPIPVYLAREDTLRSLVGFHLHRGALAAMERKPLPELSQFLANIPPGGTIAILDSLVDHTNVGAAFRSAAALGIDGVIVTPSCADPYYRRSIRVSMGTVFQVPWTRISPWPGGIADLHDAGFHVAALALADHALELADFAVHIRRQRASGGSERLALIFGTEGHGLASEVVRKADTVVRIPMAHGVDSLNVAATVAVVSWAVNPR